MPATRIGAMHDEVIAIYPDTDQARSALNTLERAGVDGNDIKLIGPNDAAARAPHTSVERDTAITKDIAKFSLLGSAAGLVVGALVGAAIGWWALGGDAIALWTATIGMAFVGLAIGGLVTPTAIIGQSPNWEQTYSPKQQGGEVMLRVRGGAEYDAARTRSLLESTGALRVEPVGRRRALRR